MFFGQTRCQCDENNQLQIPANLDIQPEGSLVLTQGFDGNLMVMPLDVFDGLTKTLTVLNMADPLARLLQRLLIGNAQVCEVSIKGTIQLPESLRQYSGISGEAVWVGQGKYLEIWSANLWQQQETDLQDFELNSHRFASLNIAGI